MLSDHSLLDYILNFISFSFQFADQSTSVGGGIENNTHSH